MTCYIAVLFVTIIILGIVCRQVQISRTEYFTDPGPPSFDELVQKTVEVTPPPSMEKEEANAEDKEKLHATKDPYDFLSKDEYKTKDTLYYANKGDLIDREWKNG